MAKRRLISCLVCHIGLLANWGPGIIGGDCDAGPFLAGRLKRSMAWEFEDYGANAKI
jgi:hypothetical protein